jgi:predicted nucleotidyltransferase component of viral defense system
MLNPQERQNIQDLFSVSEAQVNRDHAISHTLAALEEIYTKFIFFGGTALSRTYLVNGRLSEDIDLYSGDRETLCRELDHLPKFLEQEFPQAQWNLTPSQTSDVQSSLLICDASTQIKIQVIEANTRNWLAIPTELAEIHQRYSDSPPVKLFTPTFDGFVAMKVAAWIDRRAPRDLFDLEGLSQIGEASEGARVLASELSGFQVSTRMLKLRVHGRWHEELEHQTNLQITPEECLERVLNWWSE